MSRNAPTQICRVGSRALAGCCARTRRVEDGESAIVGPDETVSHIVRVTEESYGFPRWVDVQGIGALTCARARTRRVKGGNGLRRQWDGYCQGDQDGCRRHKLEFPCCEIEWFHTCEATTGRKTAHFFWRNFAHCRWGPVDKCDETERLPRVPIAARAARVLPRVISGRED